MTAPTTSSAPFVTTLRSRPGTIDLGVAGANAITIRVEIPEVWDVVRIRVSPGATVRSVKDAAVAALQPDAEHLDDYTVKFRGWEIVDQDASLADAGVLDGSILLVHYCRKRPVR